VKLPAWRWASQLSYRLSAAFELARLAAARANPTPGLHHFVLHTLAPSLTRYGPTTSAPPRPLNLTQMVRAPLRPPASPTPTHLPSPSLGHHLNAGPGYSVPSPLLLLC